MTADREILFRLRPFSLPPGERTFQFLTGWVTRLLRLGGMETTGDDPTEIRDRIEDLYAFPPARRRPQLPGPVLAQAHVGGNGALAPRGHLGPVFRQRGRWR